MYVDLRLLGNVGATVGGQAVDLGHLRQRCVLVALAVDANEVVSPDQVLERAWGDCVPHRGRDTLYSYMSRLRHALAGADGVAIGHRSGGYVLAVEPESVDLRRFGRLLAHARAAHDDEARLALLEQALGQWRGAAFAGMDTPWINEVRAALEQERFAAEAECVDLGLRLGRHVRLVTGLAAMTSRHPLDERLAGRYMLALYRSGRQADALDVYQEVRGRLSEALGVDPWPELQRLHDAILRQDPTLSSAQAGRAEERTALSPAQLPLQASHFTGRRAALASLDDALSGRITPASVVISAGAGVGKTALALHWAHRVLDRFPDGQMYADLHGYDAAGLVGPNSVLEGFLRALGFAASDIPSTVDERAALYRSALAGRRVLVLLDNARHTEQVRPLLPGGRSCVVLVTSRDDLTDLVARDGAHRLTLGALTEAEAVELLRRVLHVARVHLEPQAVVELARRCTGSPLALRLAAERVVRHRRTSWAGTMCG